MKIIGIYKSEIVSACIALLLFSCQLEEIPDEITFEKTFGGPKSDVGTSVQHTQDGGYIITGYTESIGSGGRDVYLIKTDVNGNMIFEKYFGGLYSDVGASVQETQDGGYIIAGTTESTENGDLNVYLIKTVSNGSRVFEKKFGGPTYDVGRSVQQTQDGGYIITGYTNTRSTGEGAGAEDVHLIKTDANGNLVFEKTFGGAANDEGRSVQLTNDGGYIITGQTYSKGAGESDVYLIKTDANGNIIFEKYFGGLYDDEGASVQQTQDGGYIITGYTERTGGARDVYLIKTDVNGNMIFEKYFGGSAFDTGQSVQQTQDGGYIITGTTESTGPGGGDVYLIKTDANGDTVKTNGNIVFVKTFGGLAYDLGQSVQQTQDGGYIITGYTEGTGEGESDVYLIKTNAYGEVEQ